MAQDNQSATDSDQAVVEKTVKQFIQAFKNLDWERFLGFFATDATVFFPPSMQFPRRAIGKAEIERVFRAGFDRKSGPNIDPKEMEPQILGDVAIVTFHLEEKNVVGRRTIIFQKQGIQWLIVHLHASEITEPAALSS